MDWGFADTSLTVKELKAECRRRGLTSTKDELVFKLNRCRHAPAPVNAAASVPVTAPSAPFDLASSDQALGFLESDAALAASLAQTEAATAAEHRAQAAAAAEERLVGGLFERGLSLKELHAEGAALAAARSAENVTGKLPPGLVQCPGCKQPLDLVPDEGRAAATELPKGANLSPRSAAGHNGYHRFRCCLCETVFCSSCRSMPYHMGFDCDGWKVHQTKPKCTYCGDAAEEPGQRAQEDGLQISLCCGGEKCRERANEGCRKQLACGHACRGPRTGECLPCIETGCSSAEADGNNFCNVCWTEALVAAPCVKLECGHFVHVACGRQQLEQGRMTARLTFRFMGCPICRAEKVLASHPYLGSCEDIQDQLRLAREVEELAIQRLQADELQPLQIDGSRIRARAVSAVRHNVDRVGMVEKALKKYSYYQCHFCRKPYFGGLISCEPAPQAVGAAGAAPVGGAARQPDAVDRALADVKPQELLCGKCSAGSGGANCSRHGQEFMEHKCHWCCRKVASFFCGGRMHFCDVCHLSGFSARPRPCLGGARCLFGGKHPEQARNGFDEFVLGCGICRPKPEAEG